MSARHRRSLDTLEQYCITSSYYRILNDVEGNKIIYEEKSGGNLLDVHNMKDVCSLQKRMMKSNSNYNSNIRLGKFGKECPSHSVPNYIAIVGNHSDCLQITSSDVLQFQAILKECVQPYKDGSLNQCLTNLACSNLTHTCKTHAKIVFNTFRFLSDSNFVNRPNNLKLTLVSERLNSPYDETVYQSIYNSGLKDLTTYIQGNVQVASFEFYGLKFKLFENRLFLEGALLSFAVLVVFVLIMVYSRSIFIGLMTFFCIIIAAVLAYFFYGIVYRLSFFPFLNVLTLIFLVGIGADDAFVYMGAWKEAMKLMPNGSNSVPTDSVLVQWTVYSLKHAIIAMFVTSFTTAAAFFASASSSIIAIRYVFKYTIHSLSTFPMSINDSAHIDSKEEQPPKMSIRVTCLTMRKSLLAMLDNKADNVSGRQTERENEARKIRLKTRAAENIDDMLFFLQYTSMRGMHTETNFKS